MTSDGYNKGGNSSGRVENLEIGILFVYRAAKPSRRIQRSRADAAEVPRADKPRRSLAAHGFWTRAGIAGLGPEWVAAQSQCLNADCKARAETAGISWIDLAGTRRTRPAISCFVFLTRESRQALIAEPDCRCWDRRLPFVLAVRLSLLLRSTPALVRSYLRTHKGPKPRDVFDSSPQSFCSSPTGTTATQKERSASREISRIPARFQAFFFFKTRIVTITFIDDRFWLPWSGDESKNFEYPLHICFHVHSLHICCILIDSVVLIPNWKADLFGFWFLSSLMLSNQ